MNEEQVLPLLIRKAAKSLSKERMLRKMLPVPRRKFVWEIGRFFFRTILEKERRKKTLKYMMIAIERFGLKHGAVTFEFRKLQNRAGQVQMIDGSWHITLDDSICWDAQRIASTIGHEMAHVMLFQKNIKMDNDIHQELLTDTIAALAGFALIMHSARYRENAIPIGPVIRIKKSKIGYLGRRSIKRLLKYSKWLHSETPFRCLGGKSLKEASLRCPACHQNLKMPPKTGRFIINCPSCYIKQDVRIVAKKSIQDKLGYFFDLLRVI